ncbi:MAG: hypothetical protein ABI210_01985 [Abditibacteriaceae bacterium]
MNKSIISEPTELHSWVDGNTGRRVQQLTNEPNGAMLTYFRYFRHLPDGRMLIAIIGDRNMDGIHPANATRPSDISGERFHSGAGALNPASGELEYLNYPSHNMKLRINDGRIWYLQRSSGELWTAQLPSGKPELVTHLPEEIASHIVDITCDGSTLILEEHISETPVSLANDLDTHELWLHFNRRRSGSLFTYDIATATRRKLFDTQDVSIFHIDTSPTDPTLIRYAHDMLECTGQRMFTVRTDGSQLHAIRPQEYGEMITHEFWWADPACIGFTYQDRRGDSTVQEIPLCEYAPVSTHLGIANLAGEQVYLSDALNSYHSHLNVSRRGDLVCGEGTDGNSFVFAAPFSWQSTKIDFAPMATIHTPYHPMKGQNVNADFSADSKWILFNDTIDGRLQVCRVQVEL